MNELFHKIAHKCSELMGSAWAFVLALIVVLIWLGSGPAADFSNTWQLMINTTTTILTFLMVFLIQNTQNRDAKAVHLKLDELIIAIKRARDTMVDLEDLTDAELAKLEEEFKRVREKAVRNSKA